MNQKEVLNEINRRLAAGESRQTVFNAMRNQGIRDRVVASLVASYADPALCAKSEKLVNAMVVIAWIELALGILVSVSMFSGSKAGPTFTIIATLCIAAFMYLFVWGFQNNKAWAYNTSILLSVVNLPKQLSGFMNAPIANAIALLLGVGLIAFTWYVRDRLFPDFMFIFPRKSKGQYSFSN